MNCAIGQFFFQPGIAVPSFQFPLCAALRGVHTATPGGEATLRCVRRLSALLLLLLLVGPLPAGAAPRTYVVDAAASNVEVLLHRAGALSALGHNHAIVATDFTGQVVVDPAALASAQAELRFPVRSLVVDAPQARKKAGFTKAVSESDRADVRVTMLSAKQLHAKAHPFITATLEACSGTLPQLSLRVRIQLRGVARTLAIPATVRLTDKSLHVSAAFKLRQSDFGYEPFSTALGLVAVEDLADVRVELVAHRTGG